MDHRVTMRPKYTMPVLVRPELSNPGEDWKEGKGHVHEGTRQEAASRRSFAHIQKLTNDHSNGTIVFPQKYRVLVYEPTTVRSTIRPIALRAHARLHKLKTTTYYVKICNIESEAKWTRAQNVSEEQLVTRSD